jgi:hypothetical protein
VITYILTQEIRPFFQQHTSCGYVSVEANILETDEATATSRAPSLSIVVLPGTRN